MSCVKSDSVWQAHDDCFPARGRNGGVPVGGESVSLWGNGSEVPVRGEAAGMHRMHGEWSLLDQKKDGEMEIRSSPG